MKRQRHPFLRSGALRAQIITVAALVAGAGQAQAQGGVLRSDALGRLGTDLAQVTLVHPGARDFPREAKLRLTYLEGSLAQAETGAIAWQGAWPANYTAPNMSFGSTERGKWCLAVETGAGATRALALWSGARTATGTAVEDPLWIGHIRLLNRSVDGSGEPVVLRDVFAPEIMVRHGEVFVAGSGFGNSGTLAIGHEVVWLASLAQLAVPIPPTVDPSDSAPWMPEARAIVDGVDARFLDLGDEVMVAVRTCLSWDERTGHAPLEFHRSSDLSRWTKDEMLSSRITVAPNYSIAIDRGVLYVATTDEEGAMAVLLRRWSPGTSEWVTDLRLPSAYNVVRSARERVWLFPRSLGESEGLQVFFTDPEGRLVHRAP